VTVRLREMTAQDIPGAVRLKDLAGWNQTPSDWRRFLSLNPQGCFAAEREGRLAGTSASVIFAGKLAWIGMVIVDPQHRGQGIGKALLQRAIEYLHRRQVACIKLDATPQGKPLYEKFGFASEYEIERWALKRPSDSRAVRREVRISQQDLEDVLSVDQVIFGADRRDLLHSIAAEAPEFTLVSRQEREVSGYAFGRHGTFADQLGPWMARSEDAAALLLGEFLQRSGRKMIFVDCVKKNPWVVPLIERRGFELQRHLTRMFRGTNEYAGQPESLCAILGPEFG
jgi:ribosomal protein S18 acetylase RimI-like enzyme